MGFGSHWAPGPPATRRVPGPNGSPPLPPTPHGHNTSLSFFILVGFLTPLMFYIFGGGFTPSELAHFRTHFTVFAVLIPFELAHFT